MFELLNAAAAVATIAGFVLDVWREFKRKKQEIGKGKKKG